MGEHVVLIGMMGSGKSTTAVLTARRLDWPWLDTDAEVERVTGMSVRELFEARGEVAFRREESSVLSATLADVVPHVVAVGGGAVLDSANRAAIRTGGTVVWLRAGLATLTTRVGDGHDRPLLAGRATFAVADALGRLGEEREALYKEMADVVVDVDALDPDAVADLVVSAVRTCASP